MPEKTKFLASYTFLAFVLSTSVVLITSCDSPVRTDSSTRTSSPEMIRASDGTISPGRRTIRSPGTRSFVEITFSAPSRYTVIWFSVYRLRSFSVCSERYSWKKPIRVLIVINKIIIAPSITSPRRRANALAPKRIYTNGERICRSNMCHQYIFAVAVVFAPVERRSEADCAELRPL